MLALVAQGLETHVHTQTHTRTTQGVFHSLLALLFPLHQHAEEGGVLKIPNLMQCALQRYVMALHSYHLVGESRGHTRRAAWNGRLQVFKLTVTKIHQNRTSEFLCVSKFGILENVSQFLACVSGVALLLNKNLLSLCNEQKKIS